VGSSHHSAPAFRRPGKGSARALQESIGITTFDTSEFPVQIAGEVKDFNPEDFIERKEIKKMDVFIQYALSAGSMAIEDAG